MDSNNVVVSKCAKYKFAEQATAVVVNIEDVDQSLISFFDKDVKITLTTPFVNTCEYVGRVKGKCENRAKWFNENIQQWNCEKHCKKKECAKVKIHPEFIPNAEIKTNIKVEEISKAPHRRPKTKKEEDSFKKCQQKSFDFIAQLHEINMKIRDGIADTDSMFRKLDSIAHQ